MNSYEAANVLRKIRLLVTLNAQWRSVPKMHTHGNTVAGPWCANEACRCFTSADGPCYCPEVRP